MFRQIGRNLSSRSAKKTVHRNGNRSTFNSSDAERQLLDPIERIETEAAGCCDNREISVTLGDLRKSVTCIRCTAWPLEGRYDLVRPALRHQRAEKKLPCRDAPLPAT